MIAEVEILDNGSKWVACIATEPKAERIFEGAIVYHPDAAEDFTGNYGFFGWQVCALSLLLIDDTCWLKCIGINVSKNNKKRWRFTQVTNALVVLVTLFVSFFQSQPSWLWHRAFTWK